MATNNKNTQLLAGVAVAAAAAASAGLYYMISNRSGNDLKSVRPKLKKVTSKSVDLNVPQNFVFRHECVADRTFGTLDQATVLVMVGLPGRGKSGIAQRTAQYLRFFHGVECQVFSTAEKRREAIGYADESWFDESKHGEQTELMRKWFVETLDDLKVYLLSGDGGARVAILDSSNATRLLRLEIFHDLQKVGKVEIIFVEVINNITLANEFDMSQIDARAKDSIKNNKKIIDDYLKRVEHYESIYEPMAQGKELGLIAHDAVDHECEFSYIKCINFGERMILNNIKGYMPGRISQFLRNTSRCHWSQSQTKIPKKLYLCRHGQSDYNAMQRIGGDGGLTQQGEAFAYALADYCENEICYDKSTGDLVPVRLWTSSLKRSQLTARHIKGGMLMVDGYPFIQMKPRVWSNLDEIYAGACDGMTYDEICGKYSVEIQCRAKDKLAYRFPRGESYLDVIQRIEPLVQEIERYKENLLIVGHQGVLKLLVAFYSGIDRDDAPHLEIKLNHLTTLRPHSHGCEIEVVNLMEKVKVADDGQKFM
jgi:broad specificity phosphatase PhoE/adenylate kinase family enzyme